MNEIQDQTQKLLSCIMENMADEAIEILRAGNFNKDILEDVGGFEAKLPLYMITRFHYILIDDVESWSEWVRPAMAQQLEGCRKLLDFWKSEYGYILDDEINFGPFADSCKQFDPEIWDYEMLFDADLQTLVSLGYTADECEFCYAILTFNHELIQKHLALGTDAEVNIADKPRAEIKGDDVYEDCYNALRACGEVYWDAYTIYNLTKFVFAGNDKRLIDIKTSHIEELLQAAAYAQLEKQILKRKKNN